MIKKELIDGLTENELRVYNYLNENYKIVTSLKIKDVVKETYTSASTVVRTAQKLGFEGFKELAYRIAKDKSCEIDIDDKFFVKNKDELDEFFKIIDSGKILIYAEGLATTVASYINIKFLMLGKESYLFTKISHDLTWQDDLLNNLYDGVIIISKFGRETYPFKLAECMKNNGAKLITFTANENSELCKMSDIAFISKESHNETNENYLPTMFFGHTILLIEKLIKVYFNRYFNFDEINSKILEKKPK
ncbi:MurR/RpiR family transcriptional regulator [Cetobacterium sp. 2G large]|uniref:MurR/RpiR family transcriptional regulator n=1 Tax=Cetobacterium sp. 2G large TaxID=2759680 RepID=UPI00163BDC50|nr:MurR/RpiR family transcriptional regulator [Cetobacterium sp. 2G large]MBC2853636.1 MurR/RpiR family transcriptional regulator [Cetobacterium sp. 2G large]